MCRYCSRDLGVNVQFWNIWEPRRKTHQPEVWESISCQVNQQGGTCSPKLNCHFLFIWISWDGYFAKLPVELIDLHVWDRGSSVTLLASLVGSVRQHRHWRSSPPPRPAPLPWWSDCDLNASAWNLLEDVVSQSKSRDACTTTYIFIH